MTHLRRHVIRTETEYGAVLLDERTGQYWTLNSTADLAVGVLDSGGSVADAAGAVTDAYEVEPAQAVADVERLVAELRTAGLAR